MSADAEYRTWRETTPAGWFAAAAGNPPPMPPRELREYLTEPGVRVDRLLSGDEAYLKQLQLRDQFRGVAVDAPDVAATLARMKAQAAAAGQTVKIGRNPDGSTEWDGPPEMVERAREQDAAMRRRSAEIASGQSTIYPRSNGVAGPT